MADTTARSTGNRRAVRNTLFRSMMDRPKLRESDLRPSRTILGPPRDDDFTADGINAFGVGYGLRPRPECRDTISVDGGPEMNAYSFVSPEYIEACRALVTAPPEPHPLLRLWRRLVWGE